MFYCSRRNMLEEFEMKISYKKLWILLAHKEIPKAQLRKDLGMASSTLTKLNKNEIVALSLLIKICEYLKCDIGDIVEVVESDNSFDVPGSPKGLYY